ncbi:uncharacterized protein LOC143246209 isoform X2 [Tachypleus tridentatus]|uniref:uncharacterized protein LOC143246209 isoform X2 n=1 Tax=Tachypleus tridentatus TaxID=6853 RepID=UPI003FCF1F83
MKHLPEEILINIFMYLNPLDLLAIGELCNTFWNISLRKQVCRYANFNHQWKTKPSDFERFFIKERVLNITELNISNVNWIKSQILLKFVKRCKHLEALHIVNCNFTASDLNVIFSRLQGLNVLSWSLESLAIKVHRSTFQQKLEDASFGLEKLQKLYLEIPDSDYGYIAASWILAYTCSLEEFHIHASYYMHLLGAACPIFSSLKIYNKLSVQKLSKIFFTDDEVYTNTSYPPYVAERRFLATKSLMNQIISIHNQSEESIVWKVLWLSSGALCALAEHNILKKDDIKASDISFHVNHSHETGLEQVGYYLENCDLGSVKQLEVDIDKMDLINISRLSASLVSFSLLSFKPWLESSEETRNQMSHLFKICWNITELNLTGIHFVSNHPCCEIAQLRRLRKLKLHSCAVRADMQNFTKNFDAERRVIGLHKRPRLEIEREGSVPLKELAEHCPFLEELDIEGWDCTKTKHGNCGGQDLIPVSRFKHLRALTLSYLAGVRHGKFLELIGENCQLLQQLRLHYVGEYAHITYLASLLVTLRNLNRLIDLRAFKSKQDSSNCSLLEIVVDEANRNSYLKEAIHTETTVGKVTSQLCHKYSLCVMSSYIAKPKPRGLFVSV